jgi:ATP-binding cassette, subfamily B, bacterial PglK
MLIKRLFNCFENNQKKYIFFVFLGMIFAALLEMLSLGLLPIFIASIIDIESTKNFIPFEFINSLTEKKFILYGSILILMVFICKNIILSIQYYFENKTVQILNENFASRLFSNYLTSDYLFYIKKNSSFFLRNLTTEINNSVGLVYAIMVLLREGLVALVILLILLSRSVEITLILFLVLMFTVFLFIKIFKSKIINASLNAQNNRSKQMQIINQSFGLFKTVKIFDIEEKLGKRFNFVTHQKQQSEFLLNYIKQLPKLFLEIIAIMSILVISLVFIFFLDVENLVLILSTVVIGVIRLVPAFNGVTSSLNGINSLLVSFNEINKKLYDTKLKNYENFEPINQNSLKNHDKFESMELKKVSFEYEKNRKLILNSLNFKLKKNDNIAIIGESGAGKTSLIDLILGLLKPIEGKVIINGREVKNVISFWKSKVGYVSQDVYLINDTIKNNIAFSEKNNLINNQKINKALQSSNLLNFVNSLPEKENTIIGDRGMTLSGGQRQRLSIARAIYNDPQIIVMDEGTSALDDKTENEVLDALDKLKIDKTLIVIAHRKKTIERMDKILLMEGGEIKFFDTKDKYRYDISL